MVLIDLCFDVMELVGAQVVMVRAEVEHRKKYKSVLGEYFAHQRMEIREMADERMRQARYHLVQTNIQRRSSGKMAKSIPRWMVEQKEPDTLEELDTYQEGMWCSFYDYQ